MRECKDIRAVLGDFLLGALSRVEREAVRDHLRTCADCRLEMEDVHRLHRGFQRLLKTAPAIDVRTGVMGRLEAGAARGARRRTRLLAAAAVLAAAALLVHPGVRAQAAEAVRLVLNVAVYVERVVLPASDTAGEPVRWLNADGVERVVLKVSPDGRKVWYGEGVRTDYFAASRFRWEEGARTYLANLADGSERVELPAGVRALEWSPDSRWVAYAYPGTGVPRVGVMGADGGSRVEGVVFPKSLQDPGVHGLPASTAAAAVTPLGWSAGSRSAYFWYAGQEATALFGVMGRGEAWTDGMFMGTWLPASPEGPEGRTVWRGDTGWMSPDGRHVALFKETRVEDGTVARMDLYVWSLEDRTQRLLYTFVIPEKPAQPPLAVAGWLPDNLTVLVSHGLDPAHPKLLKIRADGAGGLQEIMEIQGPLLNVSSSPDGRWLALDDEARLQIMAPDGTGRRELVGASRYETLPRWLPDGSILYYRFGKERGWWRLFPDLRDASGPASVEETLERFMSARLERKLEAALELLTDAFRRKASVTSGDAPLLPGSDPCWYRYEVVSTDRSSQDTAAAQVRVYEHSWSGDGSGGLPRSWTQEVRLVRADGGWRVDGLTPPQDHREEAQEPHGRMVSACWAARSGLQRAPWLEREDLPVPLDAASVALSDGDDAWVTVDPDTGGYWERWPAGGVVPNPRTLSGRYAVKKSGEGMRVVDTVTGAVWEIEKAWSAHVSPDGRWAAVIPDVEGSTLTVVELRSGRRYDVGAYGKPVHTSWSPDGRLALVKGGKLYLAQAPDWRPQEIGPFPSVAPYWSPDGQWLAYVDRGDVKVVRPDLSGERTLARVDLSTLGPKPEPFYLGAPAWSPDGRRLAYAARDGVYVVTLATGKVTQVAQAGYPEISWYRLLVWSPDGSALALTPSYTFDHQGDRGTAGIVVALADGSGAYQLTRGAGVSVLDWTEEGIIAAVCRCQ